MVNAGLFVLNFLLTCPEEIANLGEQRFAGRRLGRRGCFLLALEPVDRLDDEEQHPGDDREIDELGEERAISEDRSLPFRLDQRRGIQ